MHQKMNQKQQKRRKNIAEKRKMKILKKRSSIRVAWNGFTQHRFIQFMHIERANDEFELQRLKSFGVEHFFPFSFSSSLFVVKNFVCIFLLISISVKFMQRLSFECITCSVHHTLYVNAATKNDKPQAPTVNNTKTHTMWHLNFRH